MTKFIFCDPCNSSHAVPESEEHHRLLFCRAPWRGGKQSGIVLVIREDGDVLATTNRRYGGWCLPGGKVEEGETPILAAARELSEEVGAFVAPGHLVWLTAAPSKTETGRMVHMFLARSIHGEPRKVEEGTEVFWTSFEELCATEPFGVYYREAFPHGIAHLKPTKILGGV